MYSGRMHRNPADFRSKLFKSDTLKTLKNDCC
jgi:hypothetical protein